MKELLTDILLDVLNANAAEIRDVDKGEEPFLYASGNWGPGYISIKGLVGRKMIIRSLTIQLAAKVAKEIPEIEFIAGNVTGGMIPGWLLSEYLEIFLGKTVPFIYIRDARKKGGQKELITGITDNLEIPPDANALVVEELVNFAQTTCNSVEILRSAGYSVKHAACILFYNNPKALELLMRTGVEMVYLFTLPQLLEVAEKYRTHPQNVIDDYRTFLSDPPGWQSERGLKPVKGGGTK